MTELARSSGIFDRMMRAARLEVPLFEEVEADLTATNQALLVVVIVAVAGGIGQALSASTAGAPAGRLISGVLSALIGWAVWSYVVYFVGTRFVGGTATYGEVLRTLGFAETPSILLIFSFIPVLGGIVTLVALIWRIVAGFIATRQALDIDNTRTVITIVIGIVALVLAFLIVASIVGSIFGIGVAVGRLL